ncbi:MAG: DnaJ domain-containing protein [Hyphomicrobiaceae bacterium]|nr:DnaJ domain-containing protein [Hyphomicrobiaceae bacterium]
MKLDSKYFDSIRIARRGAAEAAPRAAGSCDWKGCASQGTHRAPKGRGKDGEYYQFCIEHVRQFNATYNYFEGMSKAEVEDFQKSAATGHRPTWKMGEVQGAPGRKKGETGRRYGRFARDGDVDAHSLFDDEAAPSPPVEPRRQLRALERRALETLHLAESASKNDIKSRFKELVKRHHPDANGGDRGSEDKLREIIQAYNYLKQAGVV